MDNVLVAREQRGKIINELITNKTDISLVCIKAM